jgi:hypothetical protein
MTFKTPLRFVRFLAPVALAFSVGSASAATFHSIPLAWNAPPEAGITGYKVYVGTASQQYTQVLNAGTTPALSVENMEFGKTYYFAVSAISNTGLESPFSSELVVKIAPPPLPVGGGISVNGSGQVALDWSFPVAALGSSPQFIIEASPDLRDWTPVDTVLPSQSTGGDGEIVRFSRQLPMSGPKRFYRLTAKNWMGASTGP